MSLLGPKVKSLEVLSITLKSSEGTPGSWDHLIQQSGMFGFLGLSPEVVLKLRGRCVSYPIARVLMQIVDAEHYHIYMADNSRISIAGLNRRNVGYVARSITQCLEEGA